MSEKLPVVDGTDQVAHRTNAFPVTGIGEAAEVPAILNGRQQGVVIEWVIGTSGKTERVRSCHSSASRVGTILVLFVLVRRHQYGSTFVLNQEHYEFSRFGLVGVSPDDVNIRGTFLEGLTRCQSHFLSAPHLHHD